jgi:riboflavin kinase/FMN adenylyltransferase
MDSFKGKVIRGEERGKKMGFPTANIALSEGDIPAGIYVSRTTFKGWIYPSLTFIGKPETFENATFKSETYLLDTDLDLYDEELTVELIQKIRDNMKFKDEKELISAMKRDEKEARKYFKI